MPFLSLTNSVKALKGINGTKAKCSNMDYQLECAEVCHANILFCPGAGIIQL